MIQQDFKKSCVISRSFYYITRSRAQCPRTSWSSWHAEENAIRFDAKSRIRIVARGPVQATRSKGLLAEVAAFERIRRKHSAEQEDRCGILHQQLVAGPASPS